MNVSYKSDNLEFEINTNEEMDVLPLVEMLLGNSHNATTNNKMGDMSMKEHKSNSFPPIWVVKCPNCGDFITFNRTKVGNTFNCAKCGADIDLTDKNVRKAKASYKCECGTPHSLTIFCNDNIVETKCRNCEMPIDLFWNVRRNRYEMK